MVQQQKHIGANKAYNPQIDFDTDQRQRFTEVANKALERRRKRDRAKEAFDKVKEKALQPIVTKPMVKTKTAAQERKQKDRVRYAAWAVTLAIFWLWVMYVTG